jgi:CO/xanthine dehydrogenase FAD-binding subunit
MSLQSYVRPRGLDDALAALADPRTRPLIIAGGTDVIPAMRKMRLGEPQAAGDDDDRPGVVVDLSQLDELRGIGEKDGMLLIGAATTMGAIARHELVKDRAPALAAAAASVGSPLVRNRATVGGNLATASPSADTAPALLAANAVLGLASARQGRREVSITDFFVGYRRTLLQPGEIVAYILLPLSRGLVRGRFEKVGLRNADAISMVCVAVEMELDGRVCREARIGLGAVAAVPVRAFAVEAALKDREIDEAVARECAKLVHEHISPIDDLRASARYRSWVAEAVVARMIIDMACKARS